MPGGILDFLNSPDAQLGIGLLAAGGPTTDPNRTGFGQRLAGAMQSLDAQKDGDLKRQYMKSQIDDNASQNLLRQAQVAKAMQLQSLTSGLFSQGGGQAASSGAPGMPGATDNGIASLPGGGVAMGINPSLPQQSQQWQQPQQGANSGLRGIPLERVAQLKAMGGPDMLDAWKLANVPTQLSAGGYTQLPGQAPQYLPDPAKGLDFRNGTVSRLPGSSALASLAGETAGAQAGAKMPYDIQTDRASQITKAQLDPVQAVNRVTGDSDFVPRSTLVGLGGMGAPAGTGGNGGVSLGGQMVAGTGGQPQNPYIAARNPIKQASQTALNDNWIKNGYQPVKDAGNSAGDLQASIQSMRNVDFNSGWGAENKANGAALLSGLGVSIGNSDLYASNAQKFQSVAMDKLLTTLAAQKGVQTEGDSTRAQQTFAKLTNTPEANQFILDFAQAKANRDQRRAAYYDQALPLAQQEGDLTKVDRQWRQIQGSIWADPVLQKWAK